MCMGFTTGLTGMKRGYDDDDDGDETPYEDSDSEDEVSQDWDRVYSYTPLDLEGRFRAAMMASPREDRPIALFLSPPQADTAFRYHPKSDAELNPFTGGLVSCSTTPCGTGVETVEYNLRHAVERRDEAVVASCLVELFRMFVFLNLPMRRVLPPNMDRQTRNSLFTKYGPFENYIALGFHQRIWTHLLSVCVRQVGVACPTALSSILDLWRSYEKTLFCVPYESLARLLSIGAVLCHIPKDASVAYARDIFADTSKMRMWRKEVQASRLIETAMSAHDAQAARAILSVKNVYYDNRSRLRRYQQDNIDNPHPEYADQGGAMRYKNVHLYVETIRQTMPPNNDTHTILSEVKGVMQILGANINNFHDRDAYSILQVDCQVFIYLLQKMTHKLLVPTRVNGWLADSDARVQAAPFYVRPGYAYALYHARTAHLDLLVYGVIGEMPPVQKKKAKRGHITAGILMEQLESRPPLVPRVHVWTPPSIVRTSDTNIAHSLQASLAQRNRAIDPYVSYLRKLYELERNWNKWKALEKRDTQDQETLPILMDTEMYDPASLVIVHACPTTGVTAVRVCLQGKAVMGLSSNPATKKGRTEVVECAEGTASFVAERLWEGPEEDAVNKPVSAVLIGPWELHEVPRLQQITTDLLSIQTAMDVAPDVVSVKRMMLQGFPKHKKHRLGRVYAWILVIPRLPRPGHPRVVKSMTDMQSLCQTYSLPKVLEAISRPDDLVHASVYVQKVSHDDDPWNLGDLYVSFAVHVGVSRSKIELSDVRLHVVHQSFPGLWPLTTSSVPRITTSRSSTDLYNQLHRSDALQTERWYSLARRALNDAIQAEPARFAFLE